MLKANQLYPVDKPWHELALGDSGREGDTFKVWLEEDNWLTEVVATSDWLN